MYQSTDIFYNDSFLRKILTTWFALHEAYGFCWVNMNVPDTFSCRLHFL